MLQDCVKKACDLETDVLTADLSRTTEAGECTRLRQAIAAIKRIRDMAAPPSDLRLDAMIPGADPEEWAAKKEYILRGVRANARLLSSPNTPVSRDGA